MALPTVAWSELTPPGTEQKSLGDNRIRELKTQLREILGVDHEMDSSGSGAEWGMHDVIRLIEQGAAPGADADHVQIYQREIDGLKELCCLDAAGNEVQLTSAGVIDVDAVTLDTNQAITGLKTFDNHLTMRQGNIVLTIYNTGTVTVTNGNTVVTGAGTDWDDSGMKAGMFFMVAGDTRYYEIASITNNLTLVLTEVYAGTTGGGSNFEICPGVDGMWPDQHKTISVLDHPDASVTYAKLAASAFVPRFKTGTYVGDGTVLRVHTGAGFQPKFMALYEHLNHANDPIYVKTDQDGAYTKKSEGGWQLNLIVSLDADGFTTGSLFLNVNEAGRDYSYALFG